MQKINQINYYADVNAAFAGGKANTTIDVVDTFTVEKVEGLKPGDAVARGTDKGVQVVKATTAADVIGVVVHSHKEPSEPYYAQYDAVNIMTFGDIYVEVASNVTAGDTAKLSADGKWQGAAGDGTEVAGCHFLTGAKTGELAVLRVRK